MTFHVSKASLCCPGPVRLHPPPSLPPFWQCAQPQQFFMQSFTHHTPISGGPAGWRSDHVTSLGCAQPGSVANLATRCSLTGPPCGPGSRQGPGLPLSRVTFLLPQFVMGSSGTILSLAPHLTPICLRRPYQEATDNTAPRFIGACKHLHHDKVILPRRGDLKRAHYCVIIIWEMSLVVP